jgi:hypothetical protein
MSEGASILTDARGFANMKPIEIFRTGTFTAMSGREVTFGDADLAAIAGSYDPALHEAPIVVGHPKTDDPAYGWVGTLKAEGGRLIAVPTQVDPAFAETVERGRYKKISASFYMPDSPGNPRQGSIYLKHVGFLGAAAPAVKGLKPVAFAAGEEGVETIEFAESRALGSIARQTATMFRAFRDFLIADRGAEEADKIIPGWQIDSLNETAALADQQVETPAFAARQHPENHVSEKQPTEASAADLDARAAELDRQEAAFAEKRKADRRLDNVRFLLPLVEAGKIAPGLKGMLLDFMDQLDHEGVLEFGEDGQKTKATPLDLFKDLLKRSGSVIDFAERSPNDGAAAGAADPQALANKAIAFQEEQRGKGIDITIEQAVRHVAGRA